uniref:Dolichyl-P-Glc:Glc(2)Man(9)GlcNAc(2)-PP-dolichol alpha-1,2-glucosyltransferase n=1 Tax=Globodera pallida TaxID=36090 RepID=A0A183CFI5_GLOPA
MDDKFVAFSDTDPAVAQRTQLRTNPIQNLMHGGGQRVSPWQSSSFYWLALVGLFACLLCLLLPTTAPPATDEQSANIFMPNWLRPSHTQHCVASYVLGLLTMYFFLQMN